MKFLSIFLVLIFSQLSFANSLVVGCNEQKLVCPPDRDCMWLTNMGQPGEVQLVESGTGPDFKLWKGGFTGLIYGISFRSNCYSESNNQYW